MLSIRACIGQRIHIDSVHNAVFICTDPHMDLHLMTRGGGNHALLTAENNL